MNSKDTLQTHLLASLQRLATVPFPTISGPADVKKRASVALVIRISPIYSHWPDRQDDAQPAKTLETFFEQDWVKHGTPEVLFIKRAARKGDRWTSHIALPGGKRDPEDANDLAAAIRETWEEVGLDISPNNPHVIQAGHLPQRVVTTHWGRVPLMVLCPYIFLLTSHGTAPLRLQPTEVASCHWVPLAELLNASNRTSTEEDVSSRLANQETGVRKWMLSAMVGKMVFSAIHLRPAESVKCLQSGVATEEGPVVAPILTRFNTLISRGSKHDVEPPLLLWGLTLGVVTDLLDLLPPFDALRQWDYPTFTPLDVRLAIWISTYRFKERKSADIATIHKSQGLDTASSESVVTDSYSASTQQQGAGMHGLCTGVGRSRDTTMLKAAAVSTMLDGYYDIVRRAVGFALAGRAVTIGAILYIVLTRGRRGDLIMS